MSTWVDAKTQLPVRIESSTSAGGQRVEVVLSDFVFGKPLDDGLFSLTPPQGYAVNTMEMSVPG